MSDDQSKPKKRSTSRRDFLLGRAAVNAVRETTGRMLNHDHRSGETDSKTESISSNNARSTKYWEQYSKRAMACDFEVLMNLQQYPQSAYAIADVFQLIDNLEDQLTIYRSHSEISRVNQRASIELVPLEAKLFELLSVAIELYRETGGAFDITAGALTQLWKFEQRAGALPDADAIAEALSTIGSDLISLDSDLKAIRFTKPGVKINLGGIGKGYAIDRAAEMLLRHGIADFAIHGGQSSVKAFGSESGCEAASESGWWIGISHPVLPAARLARIKLHNQALGTSGTQRQGFYHRGVRYGHILDPRTGWPASRFLSTTVVADNAAVADALATAFYVMTLETISEYCQQHPSIKAIVISDPDSSKAGVPSVMYSRRDTAGHLLLQTFNCSDDELEVESQI